MKNLETKRLTLRQWQDSDLPTYIKMGQDLEVMKFFPSLLDEQQSRDSAASISQHFAANGFGFFAVELKENNEFIGFVGIAKVPFAAHFTPAVEIGWRLASQHFNKGYATEAAREVLRFAFEELYLKEIVSFTIPNNLSSQNVMKKIGMTRDLAGDFSHPKLPINHQFCRHVLYRIQSDSLCLQL